MATRLRVGFNALAWLPGFSGGDGSYIRGLSRALAACQDVRLVVFAAPWNQAYFAGLGGQVEVVVCPLRTPAFAARALWEQLALPRWITRSRVDLFHATVNVAPLRLRAAVPVVLSVHDVTPYLNPGALPLPLRLYWRVLRRASVRKAARVIALSTHSLGQIERLMGVPAGQGEAIYLGIAAEFEPAGPTYAPGYPYLLWAGRPYPTKNVPQLVRVFRQCGAGRPDFAYHLLLAGPPGWDDALIRRLCRDDAWLAERVHRLPYQPPPALAELYRGAAALVYPSLDESFALPVAEALACGTPVVCSDAGALPEVVGAAAELYRAGDDAGLAQALRRAVLSPGREDTAQRRARGLAQAARFTWQTCAERTLACYGKTARERV